MSFPLAGRTALVTGAGRGMGRHYVEQLLERGAAKVYAGVRDPQGSAPDGAELITLDITDPAAVIAAAERAGDVDVLINNAGIATYANLVTGDLDTIRRELDTHFYGTLSMARAFAPVLARNGGGAILNVLSALSWVSVDGASAYAAAKAAEWSLTNALRLELRGQGTQVTGLFVGAVDTDMMAGYDGPMERPADVVRAALDGVEASAFEVLADETARTARAAVADPEAYYGAVGRA